jgi:hypothetical protein
MTGKEDGELPFPPDFAKSIVHRVRREKRRRRAWFVAGGVVAVALVGAWFAYSSSVRPPAAPVVLTARADALPTGCPWGESNLIFGGDAKAERAAGDEVLVATYESNPFR